jgi:hypothetical protein
MKKLLIFVICVATLFVSTAQNQSPYISKVFDFCPAPGQHVNKYPKYDSGDTRETMIKKVENCIAGETQTVVSLGGFGGYVVFGFDHTVQNVANKNDFKILGNAFGNSSEPGIVMVSRDENGNGLPDDTWFELAGSEYNSTETIKNYKITHYKTEANYPKWISSDSLIFEGTKLQDNGIDQNGDGSLWLLTTYDYGYADNQPNNSELSELDIDWAVDKDGEPVALESIDFVKVYTGVSQICGWVGEISTDITGAEDLNFQSTGIASYALAADKSKVWCANGVLHLNNLNGYACSLVSVSGQILQKFQINNDTETRSLSLPHGIYILKTQKDGIIKIYKIITGHL